jgi:hypothetical protein
MIDRGVTINNPINERSIANILSNFKQYREIRKARKKESITITTLPTIARFK